MTRTPLFKYSALLIAGCCLIKVAFASAALGIATGQLLGEFSLAETIRSTAYRVIVVFSFVAFLASLSALVLAWFELKEREAWRFFSWLTVIGILGFFAELVYAFMPSSLAGGNAVLREFASGLFWLSILGVIGAAIPLAMRWSRGHSPSKENSVPEVS